MGEPVEFASNGKPCSGYLATPANKGPGVIVIQEWWGLVPHIKDIAERFATEGFVAIAPDLYHGKITKEPDEAGKLMMDLQIDQAARDMSGAVDFLLGHATVEPKKVGSVGFCMGGALSIVLATVKPIDACVAYYGIPSTEPDYSNLKGPVLGHFAEQDDWATPDIAEKLFARLREMGKSAELHSYPATHAFFNETRAEDHPQRVGTYNREAAKLSWDRTLEFFRKHLR